MNYIVENKAAVQFLKVIEYRVKSPGQSSRWWESELKRSCLRNYNIPDSGSVKQWLLEGNIGVYIVLFGAKRKYGTIVDHIIGATFDDRVVAYCL